MKPSILAAALAATLQLQLGAISVRAAEPPTADKSNFNLLNPTPREHLRELSTDRPDLTESPFTVDAGHFQIEMDLVNYGYDHDTAAGSDTRVESWAIAPMNLKVGLFNNVDFQVVLGTYNRVRTDDRIAGTVVKQRGFADIETRLKVNLWGNDGGSTALAVMPYVKLPANQDALGNNAVEGGLIVPFYIELPKEWSMTLMTQVDILQNSFNSNYHSEFVNTITFGHDIVGDLAGYVEFFSLVSTETGAPGWIGTVDLGLTYGLTPDIQLDAGINIGVTRSAQDINPFVGISVRF